MNIGSSYAMQERFLLHRELIYAASVAGGNRGSQIGVVRAERLLRSQPVKPFFSWRPGRPGAYDIASAVLIAGLIATAVWTARDYGITNDEEVQQRYGELILAYYLSGFSDTALFHFKDLFYYGGLFDITAVLFEHVTSADPYLVRHLLCGTTGIAGIAATTAVARLIAGPRAGLIAGVALAVCGPWYGAMFNHTKDIPFAAGMMGATYFLIRTARDLPAPKWRDVLGFGLLAGAALGLRVLGLFLMAYACVTIVLAMLGREHGTRDERLGILGRSILALAPGILIAYLVMIAVWPWAALDPLNPLKAFYVFGHLNYGIRTVISGQVYLMAEVPRWYIPLYLVIRLHLLMIVGTLLALCFVTSRMRSGDDDTRRWRIETAFVAVAAILPVACHAAAHGPAFSGLRHFLFVVPAFAALAGIGIDAAIAHLRTRRRVLAIGAFVTTGAACIWYAIVLVRMHPYEYLFYNPLVGGLHGASRQFAGDYWGATTPEAVTDLESFLTRTDPSYRTSVPTTYTVAVCGERLPFEKTANHRLKWTTDWLHADFFIAPTHMNCDRALDGRVIAEVSRLGVIIGVVKDRRPTPVLPLAREH
jgi:hypothetical protein